MTRDKAIKAMAKAMLDCVHVENMSESDCDYLAEAAFHALAKSHMPKDSWQHESNGTWWQKTPTGQKMVNRIMVQL